MYPHGGLTPEQVRTTYFIAPTVFAPMALGDEGAKDFESRRALLRTQGRDLHLVGWPDGTSVLYEQPVGGLPFDVGLVVELYNLTAALTRASNAEVK